MRQLYVIIQSSWSSVFPRLSSVVSRFKVISTTRLNLCLFLQFSYYLVNKWISVNIPLHKLIYTMQSSFYRTNTITSTLHTVCLHTKIWTPMYQHSMQTSYRRKTLKNIMYSNRLNSFLWIFPTSYRNEKTQ